jgi:hypothetical protein
MFKQRQLAKLEMETYQLIKENISVFRKFDTEVTVVNDPTHYSVEMRHDFKCLIPFNMNATMTHWNTYVKVEKISFCVNSIYLIAKVHNEEPSVMLKRIFKDLVQSLHEEICTPKIAVRYISAVKGSENKKSKAIMA